jgi:hypothetical protein
VNFTFHILVIWSHDSFGLQAHIPISFWFLSRKPLLLQEIPMGLIVASQCLCTTILGKHVPGWSTSIPQATLIIQGTTHRVNRDSWIVGLTSCILVVMAKLEEWQSWAACGHLSEHKTVWRMTNKEASRAERESRWDHWSSWLYYSWSQMHLWKP